MASSHIRLPPGEVEAAEQLARVLRDEFSRNDVSVDYEEGEGLTPVEVTVVVFLGIALGTGILTAVLDWLRRRKACLLVVDVRDGTVDIEQHCEFEDQRGQIVIVSSDNDRVLVERPKGVLDLEELAKTMLTQGITATLALSVEVGLDARAISSDDSPV